MNYRETEEWYARICNLLEQQRVADALDKISQVAEIKGFVTSLAQVDELRFTYGNMLSYTMKGVEDAQREQIYHRLLVSIYELADSMKMDLLARSGMMLSTLKKELDKEMRLDNQELGESLVSLSFDHELDEMLRSTILFNDESESEIAVNHRKAIFRTFRLLWLTDKLSEDDATRVAGIFRSTSIPWYEKSMMVSALTLGILRVFDVRKLELLIALYDHPDPQISQRALVGMLIAFNFFGNRIVLYPSVIEPLMLLKNNEKFAAESESVIIQFIRSKDTEKITRKFREEIVPDVIKFNQDLNEKLDLEKLMTPEEFLDKNPDWEKYFDNQPGLVRKLEELTNMQLEGSDVFLGAFSMLKNFSFFSDLPNWFLPFYKDHYAVVNALKDETESMRKTIGEGIERSVYMCNSDKFSFILNLPLMPAPQKNMIHQMFEAEAGQLEELIDEELSNPDLRNKRIVIQYIQDLYRFFRLHPLRAEFTDVIAFSGEAHMSQPFSTLVEDASHLKTIASFFFDHDHFDEALRIFSLLEKKGESYAELFEKSGYCYQQKGEYLHAITYYRKADLFDTNRNWLLSKVAQCYLKMGDTAQALESYLELDAIEPSGLKTAAAIGTCYLNLNEPEKALDYFYRIEFADPGSVNAMRPVAWCLLITGKTEAAIPYYNQLLSENPNAFDYMNAGHLALCMGDRIQATEHYVNSIRLRGGDLKSFLKSFAADRRYLISNGVDVNDLPFVLDWVRLRFREEQEK